MNQASSFTDGGDSFGVRHACHYFIIHLEKKTTTQKLVKSVRRELLSGELLRKPPPTHFQQPVSNLHLVRGLCYPSRCDGLDKYAPFPSYHRETQASRGWLLQINGYNFLLNIKKNIYFFLYCKIDIKKRCMYAFILLLSSLSNELPLEDTMLQGSRYLIDHRLS